MLFGNGDGHKGGIRWNLCHECLGLLQGMDSQLQATMV